jgi:hypothetical protein
MHIGPVIAIVLATFSLAPCLTAKGGTLDDNLRRAMPGSEYASIVSSKYGTFFRKFPIAGFAKFRGTASGDNIVIRDTIEVQPSSVDIKTARSLASRAKLPAITTGTMVKPSVDVYVVFYNQDKPDKLALVFAVQGNSTGNIIGPANPFIAIIEYHVDSQSNDSKKATPSATPGTTPKAARAGS